MESQRGVGDRLRPMFQALHAVACGGVWMLGSRRAVCAGAQGHWFDCPGSASRRAGTGPEVSRCRSDSIGIPVATERSLTGCGLL